MSVDWRVQMNEASLQSFLSLCKQWFIKDIYFTPHHLSDSKFAMQLKTVATNKYLFEDHSFSFHLLINGTPPRLLQALRETNDRQRVFALPLIFSAQRYEYLSGPWGLTFIRVLDTAPEVHLLRSRHKKLRMELKNPGHVYALFLADRNESELKNIKEVTKYLDPETGIFSMPADGTGLHLFVLRSADGWIGDHLNFKPDYLAEEFWHDLAEYIKQVYLPVADVFNQIRLNIERRNITLPLIPFEHDVAMRFKQWSKLDFTKVALGILFPQFKGSDYLRHVYNQAQLSLLQNLANHHFYLREGRKNLSYSLLLDEPNPNTVSFNLPHGSAGLSIRSSNNVTGKIDIEKMIPGGQYLQEQQFRLKLMTSLCHHQSRNDFVLQYGEFLNEKTSFTEKLYAMHLALSLGVHQFNLDLSLPSKLNVAGFLDEIVAQDPSYPAYPEWFAYINQLSHFLRDGIHRTDVLMLYPDTSAMCGNNSDLLQITHSLLSAGIDFDFADGETWEDTKKCVFDNDSIILNQESYRFLIVPGLAKIPLKTLERILDFYEKGGIVIAIGQLPKGSCRESESARINELAEMIWFRQDSVDSTKFRTNSAGGKGYYQSQISLLPEIIFANLSHYNIKLEPHSPGVRVHVRQLPDHYHIFLFNPSTRNNYSGVLKTRYHGIPYFWNFERAEPVRFHDWTIHEEIQKIPVNLAPGEAALLLLDKKSIHSVPELVSSNLEWIEDIEHKDSKVLVSGYVRKSGKYRLALNVKNKKMNAEASVSSMPAVLKISENNWSLQQKNLKRSVALGDLASEEPFFSGEVIYRKLIVIPDNYFPDYDLWLELGQVLDWCEVEINGTKAGLLIRPPFRVRITDFVKSGENLFVFRVYNTLANALALLPDAQKNGYYVKPYGMYGPVRIVPYSRIAVELA